jgi:chromosomal replication initiation ATPase DnaA
MALSLSAKDNIFANVVDAKGKRVGNIAYTEEETGVDRVELAPGFRYELAPRPVKEKERQTLFIAAESGAGKSYFVREYAKRYKKMFPKNEIFLISYLDSDETIDEFKEITRLNCFNEEFLDQCLDLDLEVEFGHSLVIFDDIDSIVNKKPLRKSMDC